MNNRQKMRETNRKIRAELIKLGFYKIKMFGHSRFSKDVYGWDGVARWPEDVDGSFLLVWLQFKTGYINLKDKEDLELFCKKSGEKGLLAELVKERVKYKNKEGSHEKDKIKITSIGFEISF